MTALLESIDLFITVLIHMIIDPGLASKHVRVKPTLTQTKSYPNDLDNLDDPTRPSYNTGAHYSRHATVY